MNYSKHTYHFTVLIILFIFAISLFSHQFVFAQNQKNEEMGDYYSSFSDSLTTMGEDFLLAAQNAGGGAGTLGNSAYGLIAGGSCGDDWAVNDPVGIFSVYMGPMVMVVFIVLILTTLTYLIGTTFQLPNIIATAKD